MSLALEYGDLLAEVGDFLGHGRGEDFGDTAWDNRTASIIQAVVKSGLRQFYFPTSADGTLSAYDWSFMHPTGQVTLASGAQTVDLPKDFGGLEGNVTVSSTSQVFCPVKVVNEGIIREAYSVSPTSTGRPAMAAVEPLRNGGNGPRQRLYVFPQADAEYTLELAYYLLPDALSTPFPHPYGGAQHSETILESCLAIAEQRRDDAMSVHTAKFRERLVASINADRKLKAQNLGYNGDHSDGKHWPGRRDLQYGSYATINGVLY